MDCRQCSDELTAYLDGELDRSVAGQVSTHLDECRQCAAERDALRDAALFLESRTLSIEPKPELWLNVRARISTLEAPTGGFLRFFGYQRWLVASATAAVAIALMAGGWAYMRHRQSERDLQDYMTRYIRAREVQNVGGAATPAGDAQIIEIGLDDDSNPFRVIKASTFSSPFRPEGR